MTFFKSEYEAKKKIVDMLDDVSFGEAEALVIALEKWDEYDKIKEEYDFTRGYIHDNGLEWDLLSKYTRHIESKNKECAHPTEEGGDEG